MEWSNEEILEFLEAFRSEPCLWDPKHKSYKNRGAQADAWRRIAQTLTFEVAVEDLKKKKDALMGYYRIHINKYRKSLESAAKASDIYTTSWFAFDIMHSFLQPIYTGEIELKIEPTLSEHSALQDNSASAKIGRVSSSQTKFESNEFKRRGFTKKLPSKMQQTECNQQRDETFGCRKSSRELDEYDHFAFMIAAKIRKINDDNERETLMYGIQNLVYESMMKAQEHAMPKRRQSNTRDPGETPT